MYQGKQDLDIIEFPFLCAIRLSTFQIFSMKTSMHIYVCTRIVFHNIMYLKKKKEYQRDTAINRLTLPHKLI